MSKTYGFLLEFIPMKIGAGMTFLEVAFTSQLRNNYIKREVGVLENLYTCLREAASAKAGRHL